ncbi:MAG TPA: hypothetical protein VJ998_06625 [Pseudomonadales bacterium]|nr:hypothetical protein [Pseudomonadales bacterium]
MSRSHIQYDALNNRFTPAKTLIVSRLLTSAALICLIAGLTGCELFAPKPVTPPPKPKPVVVTKPPANPHRGEIMALLQQAQYDVDHNKLTTPLNDNAYFYYLRVLSYDKDNQAARQGIADIAEKYLEWSIDNANDGNISLATRYLGRAKSIDPDHPNIPAVTRLIDEHQSASRMTYYLQIDGLDSKASWLASELGDIGRTADKRKATAVITARTDAEGRWIYQQLNNGSPERIHARLEIGSKPSVRLIY